MGNQATVAGLEQGGGPGPMIGLGSDALLVTGTGGTGRWFASGFELVRLSPGGQLVWRLPVAAHPRYVKNYQVVRRGPDAVVAWISDKGIGLARINP